MLSLQAPGAGGRGLKGHVALPELWMPPAALEAVVGVPVWHGGLHSGHNGQ